MRLLHQQQNCIWLFYIDYRFQQFFYMEKASQLPKISMSELEKKVLSSHSPTAIRISHVSPDLKVAKEIVVSSPFYQKIKLKNHHNKCNCQHLHTKKCSEGALKVRVSTDAAPPAYKHPCKENTYQAIKSKQRKGEEDIFANTNSGLKILEPLAKSYSALKKPEVLFQKDRNGQTTTVHCKLPSFIKKEAPRKISTLNEVGKKIDVFNTEFISSLSQRLKNNKFKQKYVKTLYGFIKMKVNEDKKYICESRAPIENSINVLLNHFTMEQLVCLQNLDEEKMSKISYQMSCNKEKIPSILQDLKKVVADMEAYRQSVRKKQQEYSKMTMQSFQCTSRMHKLPSQQISGLLGDEENAGERSSCQTFQNLLQKAKDENSEKERQNTSKEKEAELTLNATFSFDRREENQYSNKNSSKNRKSNKQVNYDSAFRGQEYDNADEIRDNKSNRSNRSSKSVSKKKNSRLSHQNSSTSHKTKSGSRSTVYRKINEDQQEEEEEEEKMYTKKNSKKKKTRKGKMMAKTIVMDQYESKYSKIPFENYCDKSDFKFLIGQITKLDKNDTERADSAYRILKMDKIVENTTKIEQLLQDFRPLFDQGCKQEILKRVVAVRDKRHIDKLIREMDIMLNEVKKTDPRNLDSEDLFPYREDPMLKQPKQQIRIHKYKGYEAHRHSVTNAKLIDYKAHENIERHKTIQLNEKRQLEQKDLRSMRTEPTCPDLTEQIKHKTILTQKVLIPKEPTYEKIDHKKVLQYMHKHHNKAFKYLNTQLTEFCSSLPNDEGSIHV